MLWKLEADTMPTVSMTCVPEEATEVIVEVVRDEGLKAVVFAVLVEDEAEGVIWDDFSAGE